MRDKKAVSAVVATVLIILITVAAVSIIWVAVVPMVRDKLNVEGACFDAVSELSLVTDQGYTCLDGDDVNVQIAHGAKYFELSDVQILISIGGDTTSKMLVEDLGNSKSSLPAANEEKVFTIDGNYSGADKIQVAPVVKVGNTEEVCEVSATAVLKDCSA